MSVMSKGELQKIVFALSTLLDFQIPEQCDILEPSIIINALNILFPQAEPQLRAISNIQTQEEIWNYVIEFIEINILEGEQLPFQELTLKEIAQLYMILIEFTEQAIQEGQQGQQYEERGQKSDRKQTNDNKQQKVKEKKNKNKSKEVSKEKKIDNKQNIKNLQKKKKSKEIKANENEKQKSITKQKSKIKENSKSKQVDKKKSPPKQKKPAPKIVQKKAEVSSKPKPKLSPSKSEQKPKQSSSSEQPLQNQVIKQITAAMKVVRTKDKNKLLMKDPQSTQEVMKAKRKFEYYLKQFKNQGRKQNKTGKNIVDSAKNLGIDRYFLKVLQKRQKNIQQMVINEQIKYFTALRDKKVAFINKIHKLTEKLERERLTQKQKQQRRIMLQQRAKVHAKIEQGNALFQKNMQLLKQNYQALRKKRDLQQYDQRAVCKEMQSCMKKKKMQQLQDLKTLWQQENMKLNNIVGDQQRVKNRLIDIYRKNRP